MWLRFLKLNSTRSVYWKVNSKSEDGSNQEFGSFGDEDYIKYGCLEMMLKISCCKYPFVSQLNQIWEENRDPVQAFLAQSHIGVKGTITSITGKPISGAKLKVISVSKTILLSNRSPFQIFFFYSLNFY